MASTLAGKYLELIDTAIKDMGGPGLTNEATEQKNRETICDSRGIPFKELGDLAYPYVYYGHGPNYDLFISGLIQLTITVLTHRCPRFAYPTRASNEVPELPKTELFGLVAKLAEPGELRKELDQILEMRDPARKLARLQQFLVAQLPDEEDFHEALAALVLYDYQDPLARRINLEINSYERIEAFPC